MSRAFCVNMALWSGMSSTSLLRTSTRHQTWSAGAPHVGGGANPAGLPNLAATLGDASGIARNVCTDVGHFLESADKGQCVVNENVNVNNLLAISI